MIRSALIASAFVFLLASSLTGFAQQSPQLENKIVLDGNVTPTPVASPAVSPRDSSASKTLHLRGDRVPRQAMIIGLDGSEPSFSTEYTEEELHRMGLYPGQSFWFSFGTGAGVSVYYGTGAAYDYGYPWYGYIGRDGRMIIRHHGPIPATYHDYFYYDEPGYRQEPPRPTRVQPKGMIIQD